MTQGYTIDQTGIISMVSFLFPNCPSGSHNKKRFMQHLYFGVLMVLLSNALTDKNESKDSHKHVSTCVNCSAITIFVDNCCFLELLVLLKQHILLWSLNADIYVGRINFLLSFTGASGKRKLIYYVI